MPRITTVTEMTIDGKLALGPGASSKALFDFYGDELKQWFHRQRAEHDAIMVGAETVRADDPELTVRHVEGRNPLRVVPSNSGRFAWRSHVFSDGLPTLLAVPEAVLDAVLGAVGGRPGVEILVCGEDRVDLLGLMAELDRRSISSLMVEGGSQLLHSLFGLDLVSRIVIKHIPVIAGKTDAPGFLKTPEGADALGLSRWQIEDWRMIGGVGISTYVKADDTEGKAI